MSSLLEVALDPFARHFIGTDALDDARDEPHSFRGGEQVPDLVGLRERPAIDDYVKVRRVPNAIRSQVHRSKREVVLLAGVGPHHRVGVLEGFDERENGGPEVAARRRGTHSESSRFLRHDERSPVLPREHRVRLGIVLERLGFGVELQFAADANLEPSSFTPFPTR